MRLQSPYGDGSTDGRLWLRGNLHAHSSLSDGLLPLQEVVSLYADRGYDFLVITDHDRAIGRDELSALNSRGLILVPGNEVSRNGPHVVHVNAARQVEPDAERQKVLDGVGEVGGFAIMAHPNWQERFDYCSIEELERLRGYAGIEIYNGVIARLPGSPYSAGKWDILLGGGRAVWGFANDDFHRLGDESRGWNVACVAARTRQAVLDALRAGSFYASTGVTIRRIDVSGSVVTVETADAHKLVASVDFGRRVKEVAGPVISVEVPPSAHYLRVEALGAGEAFAWTQPFFVQP
jgi:hypothetical protein